jgi:hypothetical protein
LTLLAVPESPASVKVALSSPHSAVVSWAPPAKTNGILTQYNVYEREVHRSVPKDPICHTIPPARTHYKAGQLREKSVYEWWVTAVTRVGEGPSTPVMSLAASSRGEFMFCELKHNILTTVVTISHNCILKISVIFELQVKHSYVWNL